MLSSVGTPVVAVESGIITHLGWNQYGGWRIGIRSLDGKRYYYYAHLRKGHPYAPGLDEGVLVRAGDLIGYVIDDGTLVEDGSDYYFNYTVWNGEEDVVVRGYATAKNLSLIHI